MSIEVGGAWGCRAHAVERIPDKPPPWLAEVLRGGALVPSVM